MRKHNCPACNALKHGIKSRRAFEHTGCEFDRHSIGLKNHEGHATFVGKPTQEMIDAVNVMADLAYKHLKNKNMVQKFRKKPVVIEAIQWNNLNYKEISEFVGITLAPDLEYETAYLAGKGAPIFSLSIPTLEGKMKAMPNDWIIKGVNGEFYPCKPDIFEKTYDSVNAE